MQIGGDTFFFYQCLHEEPESGFAGHFSLLEKGRLQNSKQIANQADQKTDSHAEGGF